MPFDLSLPIYAAASVGLVAAAHFFARPHIRLRTYNKVHGGLRVVEIALIQPARPRDRRRDQSTGDRIRYLYDAEDRQPLIQDYIAEIT